MKYERLLKQESFNQESFNKERRYRDETLNHYQKQINHTVSYIHKNLDKRLTLEELSDKAIMSPFHFQRVFKRVTGFGFREYIRNELLDKAAEKLKTTPAKIKDIQEAAHYDSPEVFSRAFKARFGLSPSKYRAEATVYQESSNFASHEYSEQSVNSCRQEYSNDFS